MTREEGEPPVAVPGLRIEAVRGDAMAEEWRHVHNVTIARVLPGHRGRGIGSALYASGMAHARTLGAGAVETVVPAANAEGLRFAEARGFVERERYALDGESDERVDLRLTRHPA
ncbi:GNAT family N-acetyltransferase [Streptomyces sp. NPDC056568]|uniref:GNAT family N-acetyltransferase n=1 Tax=Streptomyces sp. NPDC056568 TaxID=3345866 RepID=UPI00367C0AEC